MNRTQISNGGKFGELVGDAEDLTHLAHGHDLEEVLEIDCVGHAEHVRHLLDAGVVVGEYAAQKAALGAHHQQVGRQGERGVDVHQEEIGLHCLFRQYTHEHT